MTDKLSLYNGALLECGERRLGSLTENTEPRHLLDQVWNEGAIRFMLNAGPWRFATRTVELTASTDVVSGWAAGGYSKAYEIGVRLVGSEICIRDRDGQGRPSSIR